MSASTELHFLLLDNSVAFEAPLNKESKKATRETKRNIPPRK